MSPELKLIVAGIIICVLSVPYMFLIVWVITKPKARRRK